MSAQDYSLDRGLPAAPESERCILGAILLDNAAYLQTVGRIDADDFSLDSHRRMFLRICEMAERNVPVDFNTLTVELDRHKEVEAVGGVAYVTSLTDGLPRVKNIAQYVSIVREKSQLRKVIHLSSATIEQAYTQATEASEIITGEMERLLEIYRTGAKAAPTLRDVAERCFASMREQQALDMGGCIGLTTGLQELDDATTGYRKGEYCIIGGRPSSGKSSLALQAIRDNCLKFARENEAAGRRPNEGKRVTFFSIEMSAQAVFNRLASMETGIPVFKLRDMRMLTRSESQQVQHAWAQIAATWPLELHCGATTLRELKARARLDVSKGSQLIVCDYLQHPSVKVHGVKDEFQRVTEISSGLCDIGKSNNTAVLALSQLSRPDKRQGQREPRMDDLRQSGQIEQDADVIGLLYRPEGEPTPEGRCTFTGDDKIIIAKNREGAANEAIPVWFNGPMSVYMPRHMKGVPGAAIDQMHGEGYETEVRQ